MPYRQAADELVRERLVKASVERPQIDASRLVLLVERGERLEALEVGTRCVIPVKIDSRWCSRFLHASGDANLFWHGAKEGQKGFVQGVALITVCSSLVSHVIHGFGLSGLSVQFKWPVRVGSVIQVAISHLSQVQEGKGKVAQIRLGITQNGRHVAPELETTAFELRR